MKTIGDFSGVQTRA